MHKLLFRILNLLRIGVKKCGEANFLHAEVDNRVSCGIIIEFREFTF
jgi:hypothetical protein